jgi:biotin-dependent carboxylase-like uncharacterized protein
MTAPSTPAQGTDHESRSAVGNGIGTRTGTGTGTLTVQAVGAIALLEDRGRAGFAHLGVGHSGAADQTSYDLANRLVGNNVGAPCIEATLGMLEIRIDVPALISVTGAPVGIRVDSPNRGSGGHGGSRMRATNTSFWVPADATVALGRPSAGLRSYLAVRGGLVGSHVLGSVSWDTMAQLGTPPLEPGDVIQVGDFAADPPATDLAPVAACTSERLEIPLILGPRDDWFAADAVDRLARCDFTVTSETNRIGARLEGPELPRTRRGELASEGVVLGALQVPTNGRPTLFLADHPVTGGYPVIGVVPQPWLDRAGQAAPGQRIRFRPRRLAASMVRPV